MLDLLVKNALVDGDVVDIAVSNGVITNVNANINDSAKQTIDSKRKVVIPGFVDCHMHLDKCLLNEKQVYVDGTGPEKGALTYALKKDFTKDDIKARAKTMIEKAIIAGTLWLRTNVDVDVAVGLNGIKALLELKEEYKEKINIQVVAFAQEGVFTNDQNAALLEQAIQLGADLVGGHTIVNNEGERHIDFILDLAKKYDIDADFHLDESGNRNHYLLPYLAKKMVENGLRKRVNGIHLCTLSSLTSDELKEALTDIRRSELKVTVAPTAISTRNIAPVKALLNAGVPVGLGSDNIRDFFNPLGNGDVKYVALLLSYLQRFFKEEEINQVYEMITKKGAEVLSVKNYGIRVGNKADITILKAHSPKEVIAYQEKPEVIIRNGKLYID